MYYYYYCIDHCFVSRGTAAWFFVFIQFPVLAHASVDLFLGHGDPVPHGGDAWHHQPTQTWRGIVWSSLAIALSLWTGRLGS